MRKKKEKAVNNTMTDDQKTPTKEKKRLGKEFRI